MCLPQTLSSTDLHHRVLLPKRFRQEMGLIEGPFQLQTRQGSWEARGCASAGTWRIPGVPSALVSALQLHAGRTVCLTLLGHGRHRNCLITTAGEPQYMAALKAAHGAVAERTEWAAIEAAMLPPATATELEADTSRVSIFTVCAVSILRFCMTCR